MKIKELFENEEQHPGFLTDPEEIKQWVDRYKVTNYTILPDGKVDVKGQVNFCFENTQYILVQFNKVTGDVFCSQSKLKTLRGAPTHVTGNFVADEIEYLVDCVGAPRKVDGICSFENNPNLESLKGCPRRVDGAFFCRDNPKLHSLDYAPLYVGSNFYCDNKFTIDDLPFIELVGTVIYR